MPADLVFVGDLGQFAVTGDDRAANLGKLAEATHHIGQSVLSDFRRQAGLDPTFQRRLDQPADLDHRLIDGVFGGSDLPGHADADVHILHWLISR